MSGLVEVASYLERSSADVAASYLESAGIPAHVQSDDMGGMRPYLTFGTGVRLKVASGDAEQARILLSQLPEPLDNAASKDNKSTKEQKLVDDRTIMRSAIIGIFLPPIALLAVIYFIVGLWNNPGGVFTLRGIFGFILGLALAIGYGWFFLVGIRG